MAHVEPLTIGAALEQMQREGHKLPDVYSRSENIDSLVIVDELGAKLVAQYPVGRGWENRTPYHGPIAGLLRVHQPSAAFALLAHTGWEPPRGGQDALYEEAASLASQGLLPRVYRTNAPSLLVVVDSAGQHLVHRRVTGWATRTPAPGPLSEQRRVTTDVEAFALLSEVGWNSKPTQH
ncbi:hypothetical protein [Corallococcus sp. AB038B]|uniref:hypothetical protein n=1 Tax=Corallococcus sp. AB038B TaxID=2316718 RepID=UPI000EF01728|nr:hypothetical protein [Corallococcus sp. AB038B]RKH92992.1 hypothetical protein D7Y04_41970 [Corallococcus sp. AB038B]